MKKTNSKAKETLTDFFMVTIGTLMLAAGVYFFKMPNNFATGGVSGISVILGGVFPNLSTGTYMAIINILLLIVGLFIFGKAFGLKTLYSSLLLSATVYVMEIIIPLSAPLTNQPFLELTFSVLLPAAGSALVFNRKASTGGTDIVAMILKKYTGLNTGTALFFTDVLIVLGAGAVFGIETGLFSIIGLFAKAIVVDNVIESINTSKFFVIVTDFPDEIKKYINIDIHRGATVCDCEGAFSSQQKKLILTVLSRAQAIRLKAYLKTIDKHAFVVTLNSSDIIGKGFREAV